MRRPWAWLVPGWISWTKTGKREGGVRHLVLLCQLKLDVGVDGDEVERTTAAGLDGVVAGQLVKDGREHLAWLAPTRCK